MKHVKAGTTEVVDFMTKIAMLIKKFKRSKTNLCTVQLLPTKLALLGDSLYLTRFNLNYLRKLKYDHYLYRKAIRVSRKSVLVLF